MSRTFRHDNGFNHGRDDRPVKAKHWPNSKHPNGFDTNDDDHGRYNPAATRWLKKEASAARRNRGKRIVKEEVLSDVE